MKKTILLVAIAWMAVSCSSLKVVSDYDKTADFTGYKTLEFYGWKDNSDQILNRFDKERIELAFKTEFDKRGISVVKSNPDIIVSLYIVTEKKTQTSATTNHMGGYGGYGGYYGYGPGYGWGGGHSTTTFHEYDYTVGTLIVSVYDAAKKELVWESIGEGTVDDNPKSREENVGKAVAKIMESYPIKPTS